MTNATDAAVADLVVGWSEIASDFPGGCSARQALDALDRSSVEKYSRLRAAVAVFALGPLDDRGTADRLGRSQRLYRDELHEGHALVLAQQPGKPLGDPTGPVGIVRPFVGVHRGSFARSVVPKKRPPWVAEVLIAACAEADCRQ